jgi:hypothetical protein
MTAGLANGTFPKQYIGEHPFHFAYFRRNWLNKVIINSVSFLSWTSPSRLRCSPIFCFGLYSSLEGTS